MKKNLSMAIVVITTITLSILGFVLGGFELSDLQKKIFIVLLIICASSALYCFIVGEIAKNNSQMDKLWSLLPIAYTWVIAAMGGMDARLVTYAAITTLWGFRLTFNFARKGAYRLRFWEGEEDYRWEILRKTKFFNTRFKWAFFDLFFICIYQNALVLAMCLPALACVGSQEAFGAFDFIAAGSALFFLLIEFVADEEQWKFQETKKKLLKDGKTLSELDYPYNIGFNTQGLWGFMRHPNYLGEQAIWLCLYIFTIGAGVTSYAIFNWTLFGPMFIVLLFLGSSTFGEAISSSKYPLYKDYQSCVFKYRPIRKFRYND